MDKCYDKINFSCRTQVEMEVYQIAMLVTKCTLQAILEYSHGLTGDEYHDTHQGPDKPIIMGATALRKIVRYATYVLQIHFEDVTTTVTLSDTMVMTLLLLFGFSITEVHNVPSWSRRNIL